MMLRTLCLALGCSMPLLVGQAALAQTQNTGQPSRSESPVGLTAMAIDDELRTSILRVLEIEGGAVTGEDGLGVRVRYERGELVALVRVSASTDVSKGVGVRDAGRDTLASLERLRVRASSLTAGFLTTTDGRRYTGRLGVRSGSASGDAIPEDVVIWMEQEMDYEFPLEEVASVVLNGAPASVRLALPKDVASDTLLLTNGDVLEGFLASIADEVVLERDDGGETRLEAERINAVVLANPAKERPSVMAWLDDGSLLGGDRLTTKDGRSVSDMPDAPTQMWIPLERVRAVTLRGDRITPLSALSVASGRVELSAHPDDALLERTPALGARDVLLEGGSETVFTLPAGTQRFAATPMLERGSSSWADCVVVVLVDGVEAVRVPLRGGASIESVNIALPPESLEMTVRVEEGRFGTIHDRVRLSRPLILTED